MNAFNSVFLAIKECCNNVNCGGKDCLAEVSYRSGVPLDRLNFYLNILQDLGLIKYSWDDKTIHLTGFGKMQERLFA